VLQQGYLLLNVRYAGPGLEQGFVTGLFVAS